MANAVQKAKQEITAFHRDIDPLLPPFFSALEATDYKVPYTYTYTESTHDGSWCASDSDTQNTRDAVHVLNHFPSVFTMGSLRGMKKPDFWSPYSGRGSTYNDSYQTSPRDPKGYLAAVSRAATHLEDRAVLIAEKQPDSGELELSEPEKKIIQGYKASQAMVKRLGDETSLQRLADDFEAAFESLTPHRESRSRAEKAHELRAQRRQEAAQARAAERTRLKLQSLAAAV